MSIQAEELLDLVNEHDEVIETMPRSEVFSKGLLNFRLICVMIKNDRGEFLIPRRSSHKKVYPNALSLVAGCVQSGETYEQAFFRELIEETMLNPDVLPWKFLGYATPWQDDTMGYTAVYELCVPADCKITFLMQDFSELLWLLPEHLQEIIEQKSHETTHNLPILFKKFYQQNNN